MSFFDKILAGDEQAVRQLYDRYSPKILHYLVKRLPSLDDSQEVCNDVFFEAIDSLVTLKKQENILQWLYGISRYKVADFYRKKKIKSVLLSQVPFLVLAAKEINQPEFQFEKTRLRDKIENTLKNLSHEYQRILNLHYVDKIPVKELSPMFNLSFKATESLLYRARQSFKRIYERE